MDISKIASFIDHTLLKAVASKTDIEKVCREALQYNFASVCVNPCHVKLVAQELRGSEVKVCTVIGFPLGANTTETKIFEAKKAVSDGAHEVDMVINIGALKDGDYELVENEIFEIKKASSNALLKVIIETCYLTDDEKKTACKIARKAGADFVKTSTGFGTDGAKKEDIVLMREAVGNELGVKASGNVKTLKGLVLMVENGANRIGTSGAVSIINEIV